MLQIIVKRNSDWSFAGNGSARAAPPNVELRRGANNGTEKELRLEDSAHTTRGVGIVTITISLPTHTPHGWLQAQPCRKVSVLDVMMRMSGDPLRPLGLAARDTGQDLPHRSVAKRRCFEREDRDVCRIGGSSRRQFYSVRGRSSFRNQVRLDTREPSRVLNARRRTDGVSTNIPSSQGKIHFRENRKLEGAVTAIVRGCVRIEIRTILVHVTPDKGDGSEDPSC